MKKYRIIMMSVAMLMASVSLMAQHVTTTLKGSGLVGMYGFPCTLTIKPDGNGIIEGEATKELSSITVKFKAQPHILYEALKNGFIWSYIKDITVSPFTIQDKKSQPAITPKGNAKFTSIANTDAGTIKLYVRFPTSSANGQSVSEIEFKFPKNN